MNYEQKHQEDLQAAKDWLAIAKENNNTIAIQILENLFPELRESEDEKIRKELIQYFEKVELHYMNRKEILAWLEKQGEQKPVDKIEQSCYHNDGLYYAIDILEKTLGKVEGYQSDDGIIEHQTAIETVNALYHKKPAEWSEEDEILLTNTIILLKEGADKHFSKEDVSKCVDWLKSLKPQPNQELGDEEKRMVNATINVLRNVGHDNLAEYWLKVLKPQLRQSIDEKSIPSKEFVLNVWMLGNEWKDVTKGVCGTEHGTQLEYIQKHWKEGDYYEKIKPQPHWKPSEAQMKALLFAKDDYIFMDIKNYLEQLYNELKKL